MGTLDTSNETLNTVKTSYSFNTILEKVVTWFSENLEMLLFISLIIIATVLIARTINNSLIRYYKKASNKLHIDLTTFRMFRHLVVAAVYFIGLVVVIFNIPSLRSLSVAMLSGAGIAGIIIGFASQNTLSNIIAGVALAIFQPFRVGDRLTVMNEYGKVTDLNLRHTVILTSDNRRLIIPNSVISSEAIYNWTIEDPATIWPIDIGISYDTDISLAKKIMIEEARKHPKVMPPHTQEYCVLKPGILKTDILANRLNPSIIHTIDPDFKERGQVKVYLTEFGDSAINLRMHVWFKDRSDAYSAASEIREAIKVRFDNEDVEMPYPYRTIVFKTGSKIDSNKEEVSEKPVSPEEIKIDYSPIRRLNDTENKKEDKKEDKKDQ